MGDTYTREHVSEGRKEGSYEQGLTTDKPGVQTMKRSLLGSTHGRKGKGKGKGKGKRGSSSSPNGSTLENVSKISF